MADARETGKAIAAKVAEEATAAEAEEPAEEQTETTEPEPEPEDDEEGEQDDKPAEPQTRRGRSPQEKFQAAFSAFVKKAAECFEITPAEVVPAPHPGVVGIMLPGFAEPRTHDNYKRCTTCNGLGKVLTSAQTGDVTKDWHVCPDGRCKGQGYWTKNTAVAEAPATGPLAVLPPPQGDGEYAEAPAWLGDPNLTPAS